MPGAPVDAQTGAAQHQTRSFRGKREGSASFPHPSSPLGALSVPWARPSALPWEGTKAVAGHTTCECCHPTQQGLGKSIIGLAVRKAIPEMALGASLSSQGGHYCLERGINMQPVVQELPTPHGRGGQEEATERDLG